MPKLKLKDLTRELINAVDENVKYAADLRAEGKLLLKRLQKLERAFGGAPEQSVRTPAPEGEPSAAPAPVAAEPQPEEQPQVIAVPQTIPVARATNPPQFATMEKICRTCKVTFAFPMSEGTYECPTCGAVNGRPKAQGASGDHLKHATRQRLACDFHNAEISYQHVLLDHPDEHEALYGLSLCRYGVEYVEDPRTGKLMPTVHSVRKKPMQTDHYFLAACDYAPEEVRAQYEAEAQYIDDAMARIRKLAETQRPYDVFICHKTTVPGSKNLTPEYGKAAEMAHHLEKQGYRVFFAPEAIKSEQGSDYEAAIYHGLDTAKVMLMFCSNADYVTSAWVRSEWTRFLEMTLERDDKRLVPLLYGDFTPAKLPREIRPYRLECVTMDSFTAAGDILRLLEKFCGKRGAEEEKPAPKKPAPAKPAPAKSASAKPASAKPTPAKPAPAKPAPAKKTAPSIETLDRVLDEMDMYPVETENRLASVPVPTYAPESDFETVPAEGGCSITKYCGKGGKVNVPPTIGGQKVVEIGMEAFRECSSLTSITLPDGVTSIGELAFLGCSSLTSITLPEGVTSIGNNAFSLCYGLTNITLPDSVTSIGYWAFLGCSSLMSVSLPEQTIVSSDEFENCDKLKPENIVWRPKAGAVKPAPVEKPAVEKKPAPTPAQPASIYAPEADYEMEPVPGGCAIRVYKGKGGDVKIPSTIGGLQVVAIGNWTFQDCRNLTSITLPESVTSIGDWAFKDCRNLTSITLPKGVTRIGDWAFQNCSSLTSITLPEGMTVVRSYAFAGCTSLTSVTIPNGVKQIMPHAFSGCKALTRAVIPASVKQFGLRAFEGCDRLPLVQKLRLKIEGAM